MKKLITWGAGFIIAAFGVFALAPVSPSLAQSPLDQVCDSTGATDNTACGRRGDTAPGFVTTLINVLLFIIGAVAVVMIIWAGIRYATSSGNSAALTGAKNTLMYSIIGLVVAFLAYAIVNWVIAKL